MKNIPDKCLKCGAPIKWDKSSNYIDCEYCGYSNLINLGSFSNLINSLKIAKKSPINLFYKGKRFSKSIFLKAKNSSSNLSKFNKFSANKKLILILPISLLGLLFLIVRVNQNHQSNMLHRVVLASEIIRLDRVCTTNYKNRFFYINGKKFDNRFIGDWESAETTAKLRICILNNNILFLAWSGSTSFVVNDITWTGQEIKLNKIFPTTNWKTLSDLTILSADRIKAAGTNPQGKYDLIYERTRFN